MMSTSVNSWKTVLLCLAVSLVAGAWVGSAPTAVAQEAGAAQQEEVSGQAPEEATGQQAPEGEAGAEGPAAGGEEALEGAAAAGEAEPAAEEEAKGGPLSVPVAFASVFVLGIIFALIGSIKLRLAKQLEIDDEKAGSLISALMFCSLVMVLIIGPLRDQIGYRPIALVGFIGAAILMWVLAAAETYVTALVACLLLGIGAMCVNTTGNTLGPEALNSQLGVPEAAASNIINIFYGVGAFVTPLLVVYLIKRFNLRTALKIMGLICLAPVILALVATFPPPAQGLKLSESAVLVGDPRVIMAGLSLICYIGLEASMGGFITTYLTKAGYEEDRAGTLLSGFWISLMIARVVAGFSIWGSGMGVSYQAMLIVILALVAIASIGVMVAAETRSTAGTATIVTGLAFGPIFPTLVGVSFAKMGVFEKGTAYHGTQGSVFGIIFSMGLIGAVAVPYLIGRASARKSIRHSLRIAVVVAAALFVCSAILWGLPNAY